MSDFTESFQDPIGAGTSIPILQMEKPRFREMEMFPQGDTAGKQELGPDIYAPRLFMLQKEKLSFREGKPPA